MPQFEHKLVLNGRLIDVLAHLDQPVGRSDLLALPGVSSAAWFDRHVHGRLRAAGLVEARRDGRRTTYVTRDPALSAAARALLAQRPDVRLAWRTSLELRVLLTLPLWRGPPDPWHVAGCGSSAWWHTLAALQDAGFVLRGPGVRGHHANPRLSALSAFLDAMHRQLRLPPADLTGTAAPVEPIHTRGAEAAWRVPAGTTFAGYAPVGPPALPQMAHLVDPFVVAYAGPRTLDPWDHALLYARAHTPPAAETPARVTRLLAFLAGRVLPTEKAFQERADFYGLSGLPHLMAEAWAQHEQDVRAHARSGAQEGLLDLGH